MTPTLTMNLATHVATANPATTEKTTIASTATPKASIGTTTTLTTRTTGSVTPTTTATSNATDNRRSKTLTETKTCDDAMPTATAARQDLTILATIALDAACPHWPLKPESCASSLKMRIGRWRTC